MLLSMKLGHTLCKEDCCLSVMTVFMSSNFHCYQHFLHVISLIHICCTFSMTLDVRDTVVM